MPTIAVVGAGPSLGFSIGEVFGRRGFDVALISRNPDKLDRLAAELRARDITADAFPADVSDHDGLTRALGDAATRFGGIDVLEFSPLANLGFTYPAQVTLDTLRPQIESLLYGTVTAVNAVLPNMIDAGAGTILLTTGGGAINPYPMLATTNIAQAGMRNWARNLHNTLADKGIYVAAVAIDLMISNRAPDGVTFRPPEDIAPLYWGLYTDRTAAELVID